MIKPQSISKTNNYVHAARFKFLTRFYDPLVRVTCRETYFKKRMLDEANLHKVQSVLDVGCGTGTLLLQMNTRKNRLELHGLDGDPEILKQAQQKADKENTNIQWLHAYSTNIPLDDNSMDLLTNSLMIHHLMPEDKTATFLEMHRVLKPGGKLVLVDWGKPANIGFRGLFKFIRLLDGHKNTLDHLYGKIPDMIQSAGFEQVDITEKINTMLGTLNLITAKKKTGTLYN